MRRTRVSISPTEQLSHYYAHTADRYDRLHGLAEDEHLNALWYAACILTSVETRSVLDVGCGTGRAMAYLREAMPGVMLHGLDPSPELLQLVEARHGFAKDVVHLGDGANLPFEDAQFDAVIAVAVMHHVADPQLIIAEMLRVARKAVVISDTNTFGQGGRLVRGFKLAARSMGLSKQAQWLAHRGKRYYTSDDDGVAFPYSVFDSVEQIREGCRRVIVLPTRGRPGMDSWPLLNAINGVVIGVKGTE